MFDTRIHSLIAKYLCGTLTKVEQEELDAWIDVSPANRTHMEQRMTPDHVLETIELLENVDEDRIFRNFLRLAREQGSPISRRIRNMRVIRRIMAAAAVVIPLVLILWYVLEVYKKEKQAGEMPTIQLASYRKEGGDAVIVSGEGKSISLERSPVGQPMEGNGYVLSRTGKRSLSLQLTPGTGDKPAMQWTALISVPYGQQWQLTLPDGTWMKQGPGSVLAIPPDTKQKRELLLDGEAFFHVAPDKQLPFRVKGNTVNIDVLGTDFNIRAFSDENKVTTTLLSGKVKVTKGAYTSILLPGQEATADGTAPGIRVVEGVDTADRMAWLSEYFNFNDLTIPQVMRQVGRWYGMKDVVFQPGVDTLKKGLLGGGHVGKDISVHQLLQILASESHMTFRIINRKILVGPVQYTSLAYAPFRK